jgi:hypothetical protein
MHDSQSQELQRLATIPRGRDGTEELRISLDEFCDDRGIAHQYVSVRIWFRVNGEKWLPSKKGVTVRKGEIQDFGKALRCAFDAMNGRQPVQEAADRTLMPSQTPRQRSLADDGEDLSCGGIL